MGHLKCVRGGRSPHPCHVLSDSVQGCPTILPPPGPVTLLLSWHQMFQAVSLEGEKPLHLKLV